MESQKNKVIIGSVVGIILILILGFFLLKKGSDVDVAVKDNQITVTGMQACLPPADANAPATKECRAGLKTAQGLYYALDLQSPAGKILTESAEPKDVLTLRGHFVPQAALSSDMWQKYSFEGVLTVSEIVLIDRAVRFSCANGESIGAVFHISNEAAVTLTLRDSRTVTLQNTVSASGVRYANKDESFVFWSKGAEAFVTENGTEIFGRCVTNDFAVKG